MRKLKSSWLRAALVVTAAGAALVASQSFKPKGLPKGFARANGRIEATEIDISAKIPGRIDTIQVYEGETRQGKAGGAIGDII